MTYVLAIVVVVIWGVIIFRVIDSTVGDDATAPVIMPIKKEPYNDYAMSKDTAHLRLNYRDPFGMVKVKDTSQIPVKKLLTKKITSTVKTVVNWGFIHYAGYIRNPASKKLIALVSINGKNETFSEGQSKDGVRLIKNFKDSIKVSFNGLTKNIVLK